MTERDTFTMAGEFAGRETPGKGRVKARIPRDSGRNVKEREAVLQVGPARYEIQNP
jgi:hypothetical protein